MKESHHVSRRNFVKKSVLGAAGTFIVPVIVPSTVFGKNAPGNKISIGQIGCGRIGREHDIPMIIKNDIARYVACSDLDTKRLVEGKKYIEKWYTDNLKKTNYVDVKTFPDYRDLLLNKDIDAVVISLPDHWHAQVAIEAALAGKDIYLQKPASLTIKEGRQMSNIVNRTGVVFQMGSQQRGVDPWPQFRRACELVRNGRIGKLHTVYIGLPGDPSGPEASEMPVPKNLNYDMWLGSTPYVYYTEIRVHPQNDYSRPGWLRCEQFGAGMITGWGAHHIDTAHWAMGTEFTGPIELIGIAEFPKSGLWDVHGKFNVKAKYANGVTMNISGDYPNGVRFEGSEGWIFVTRGNFAATSSDPVVADQNKESLNASDPKILTSVISDNEIHLYHADEQHKNWLDCIISRAETIAPAEVGHRSCSACLLIHIAMKINRKLFWDPQRERFINDDDANKMLSLPQRFPYGTDYVLDKYNGV
jgi:myo-inositol 2-dehydrogenase / D-chiro-inositol 1-dehydrogenase